MNNLNDEKVLRGGLIGCGFFARNQVQAWRDLPQANIVAVCDRDASRVSLFRQDFQIHDGYTDTESMLSNCELDFVDIVAPTAAHRALVTTAANHGVHIICQKPFAGSLQDARDLIELCAAQGVSLTIHENFRWQGAICKVRDLLDAGAVGTPFFGRISYRCGYDVFANQPYLAEIPRFIIQDLGIHVLDMARALFGDVKRLSCETHRVNENINGEDTATIMLRHDSGTVGVVDCSYATKLLDDPFPQSLIEIDGDKGSLRLKQGYQIELHDADGNKTCLDATPDWPQWSEQPWATIQESVVNLQRDWVDSVLCERLPATHGADNFNTLALVDAAYQAAETTSVVEPKRWLG